jgi:hypothetical protein
MQKKHRVKLPIGKAAKIVFDIDALRAQCSQAAQLMLSQTSMDGLEFEECAMLDEALAEAHNILKGKIRRIMLSRISRHTQAEAEAEAE